MRRQAIVLALAAVAASLAAIAVAGPLDPPAGPVTSSYKTLTEVEPRIAISLANTPGDANSLYKITQPGSYYLTGNITGVANKHGIEITSSGVTIDLNGFDLVGVPAMGAFDGVSVTVSSLTNVTVRDGSVRNWGDEGVDLFTNSAFNSAIIGVRASGNAGNGIMISTGGTISGCSAHNNTGNGITTSTGSTITGCIAYNNTGSGISAASSSTLSDCTAYSNTLNGIDAGSSNRITGCTASGNTVGIETAFAAAISNCTANNNSERGFSLGSGSTISVSTADSNQTDGIYADRSTIVNCTTRLNRGNGISVFAYCLILSNSSISNGYLTGDGAGIHTVSGSNRIEGNVVTANDRGIEANYISNIIIKNTCGDNTVNWDIAANNIYGTIIDRTAPATAAVTSNAASNTLGTTEPNANFSY